jgi:hypothetical protein
MTRWYRLRRAGLVILAGGMLLQTTTSCQDLVAPLVANLLSSLVLNALLGGLTT